MPGETGMLKNKGSTSKNGTVIQVFGRVFSGLIDMRMEDHYKVVWDFAEEPFRLTGVSPFSLMGRADPDLQKYTESERTNPRVKADIRKNFDRICEKSYADYFVMDNTPAMLKLAMIHGQFYSLVGGEKTDFMDEYFNCNQEVKKNCIQPVNEGFSERLRAQYDLFIGEILHHYDSSRILLIRSHVPYFFPEDGKVQKTGHGRKLRMFLDELDAYFSERTNCTVIETPLRFFETGPIKKNLPFQNGGETLRLALECDIINRIENPEACEHVKEEDITRRALSAMAEYIDNDGDDLKFISQSFDFSNLSCDDIVALFYIYDKSSDKTVFSAILENVLSNKNSLPYRITKDLFLRNVSRLKNYQYNLIDIDGVEWQEKIFLMLDPGHFIEIGRENALPYMQMIDMTPTRDWDYRRFVADGCACGIEEIDHALESFEAYFERARRGMKNPFILLFDDRQAFERTLYFKEYEDILENENYFIALSGVRIDSIDSSTYAPKVDCAFLFDDKTRVLRVSGGLSDQKNFVFHGYRLRESGLISFYDDLIFDSSSRHNGMEVQKLCAPDFERFRLSRLFSRKLRLRYRATKKKNSRVPADVLYDLGLNEMYAVVLATNLGIREQLDNTDFNIPLLIEASYNDFFERSINKIQGKICYTGISHGRSYGFKDVYGNKPSKKGYEEYYRFHEIEPFDLKNHPLSQNMLNGSAISIHFRRGDYVVGTLKEHGYENMCDKYKTALEFIYHGKEFERYKNKHLYVFSDDSDWVREHHEELGLGIAGDRITFVDWNHHFDSIKDMILMSLSKVIIPSVGGFARSAAQISQHVDYVVRPLAGKAPTIEYKRETGAS
jgi:hypothetical protein